MIDQQSLIRSADNLLTDCMEIQYGDSVLAVIEPDSDYRYDPAVGRFVADRAKSLGCEVEVVTVDPEASDYELPDSLQSRMGEFKHALFFNRLGDFARFDGQAQVGSRTMSYTRSFDVLASDFCAVPHSLMQELLNRFETRLRAAHNWSISCPAGTSLEGRMALAKSDDATFSMNFFPVTTFIPIPCTEAYGNVALTRWLLPVTAPRVLPCMVPFPGTVTGEVEAGRIKGFRGERDAVAIIRKHYERVGQVLGYDSHRVHSWHTGMNPMTRFERSADQHLEEWESISFASPGYLHFHTAGEQAPGEVAWSLFNATVSVDSEIIIQDGQMVWFQNAENIELIRQYDCIDRLTGPNASLGL